MPRTPAILAIAMLALAAGLFLASCTSPPPPRSPCLLQVEYPDGTRTCGLPRRPDGTPEPIDPWGTP